MTHDTKTDSVRVEPGMRLRATTSGWTYRVTHVTETSVRVDGKMGPMAVDRAELEDHLARGLVTILEWR